MPLTAMFQKLFCNFWHECSHSPTAHFKVKILIHINSLKDIIHENDKNIKKICHWGIIEEKGNLGI